MHTKLLIKEKFFIIPFNQIIIPLKNFYTKYAFLCTILTVRKLRITII
jgi:hypothetical protein